jgi:sugar lactone lactonase YvrE
MSTRSIHTLAEGFSFLESPRWHDGRLWLSDFYTQRVVAITPEGAVTEMAEVHHQPSGLGWLPDGRLLIVSMRDRRVWRQEADGELALHADLSELGTGLLNDMVVDAEGCAYVGSFGFDLHGGADVALSRLTLIRPDGTAELVGEPLSFPNGMVITPDGSTLVVAESFGNRLSALPIGRGGTLGARRTFAEFGPFPGEGPADAVMGMLTFGPDGICLDAEGAVWVTDALGQQVVRVADGGEVLEQIDTAPDGVFACMLGGADGCTLYLCAAPDFFEEPRRNARESKVLAVRVDVPGAGRP